MMLPPPPSPESHAEVMRKEEAAPYGGEGALLVDGGELRILLECLTFINSANNCFAEIFPVLGQPRSHLTRGQARTR